MRTISQALPALAANPQFKGLAAELHIFHRMLRDHSAGLGDMPTAVLTAAFEVLGTAPRKRRFSIDYTRKGLFLDLATSLIGSHRPEQADVLVAVGVWGAVISRASQVYRGLASDAERAIGTPYEEPTGKAAAQMCSFVVLVSRDLPVLVAEADTRRVMGPRGLAIKELRDHVAAHPHLKRDPAGPKSGVRFKATDASEPTSVPASEPSLRAVV